MLRRIAYYLLIMGAGFVGWFILSDIAGSPDWVILLLGGAGLLVGFLMLASVPNAPPTTGPRFRLLRRVMQREADEGKKPEKPH
jgi:hypothetical protein